jgi:hypothetical protein
MSKAIFDELVLESATELFLSRGLSIRPGRGVNGPIEYAATLGFSADKVRGMIGLGMDPDTLQGVVQRDPDAGPDPNLEDWLGESVNQLLGRLKNKLVAYDLNVSLALPTVLRGIHLRFMHGQKSGLWTYSFECDAGPICVWLDVRRDPDFVLVPTRDPAQLAVPEGELVLF